MARGPRKTSEYKTWLDMWRRCTKPTHISWCWYGARGIQVDERWVTFEAFFADMGLKPSPQHQIDRIDNDGNYGPGNCRWVTSQENSSNTRKTKRLEFGGHNLTQSEWARVTGLSTATVSQRVTRGWTAERILTTPSRNRGGPWVPMSEWAIPSSPS
jgi:hypothetical protein